MSRTRAGRPTRERAEARQAELLEQALTIFLEKGFERTTIEAVAASVGMTKRTIYASYADKSELFMAAVRRAIERYSISAEALRAIETDDLETTIAAVARMWLHNLMTPGGLKLQRILNNESYRFPEIYAMNTALGIKPTKDFLARLLERHAATGKVVIECPDATASSLTILLLTGPTRAIVAGGVFNDAELDKMIDFSIRLFMNGVRPR